jgi:deoxyribodipyrimidine photo-lyase
MNEMEQQFYNCDISKDYPAPIVNIEETRKYASDIVWSFRKKDEVKQEGKRILQKHVSNPNKPKNERRKKTKLTYQNLRRLPKTLHLAQEMGKSLGRSKIL